MALTPARRAQRQLNLVEAARDLMREGGDAGFSMGQLAARAGVSPATPYNLIGTKSDLLQAVVAQEFESFSEKLRALRQESPLAALIDATDTVVSHYVADRQFYRGLFHAALGSETPEVHELMLAQGQSLWRGLVKTAHESGELLPLVEVSPFTDVLLRILGITTRTWLAENWSPDRFAAEMTYSIRLILLGAVRQDLKPRLIAEMTHAQAKLKSSP